MDGESWDEIVDVDESRLISLQFARQWPKYIVTWTVRRRVGDSDYPLAEGTVERIPPSTGGDSDAIWDELRTSALDEANAAASSEPPPPPEKRSLFGR